MDGKSGGIDCETVVGERGRYILFGPLHKSMINCKGSMRGETWAVGSDEEKKKKREEAKVMGDKRKAKTKL